MSVKNLIKKLVRLAFNAPSKKIYAQILYTQPGRALVGKKIIITGGASGLGAAMAKKFKENGAEVLIAGRNENLLKETAEKINCKYLMLDTLKTNEFEDFVLKADDMLGGVNVLVNNAAISLHEKSFFDVTEETFDQQINTNLKGSFFLSQHFLKYLKSREKKGNVLFVSSETALQCDHRPYSYTKTAINSMVQGLAYLFHKDGIRVNAICPGPFCSKMSGKDPNGDLYMNDRDRWYLPEELAEVALFLISDVSGCISGQIIACNNTRTYLPREK